MDGRVSVVAVVVVALLHMVSPSWSGWTLDPNEVNALKSMKIPMNGDPCLKGEGVGVCDGSSPYKHLVSLRVANCSDMVTLSTMGFQSLSSLTDLQFLDCPSTHLVRLPPQLASNLNTFTCLNSLKELTGVWLSRLSNLTYLTVSGTPIIASGPSIFLTPLKYLNNLTISSTNLTGYLPNSWNPSITHLDLSQNNIKGHIPPSISQLKNLISLDLSSNQLHGYLPTSIGLLSHLNYLSLSSNSLSRSLPQSLGSISTLLHLDLSSNDFNGTIPDFLTHIKGLKYLNLEKNNFHGVIPFTDSFINRLTVFKVGDNPNLCYNKSRISSKLNLGISPCDKNGFPITQEANSPSSSLEDYGDRGDESTSGDDTSSKGGAGGSHGPNKVVLGIAITLSCIVLLIIFLIILAKKCT